jgi:hypothetical protein
LEQSACHNEKARETFDLLTTRQEMIADESSHAQFLRPNAAPRRRTTRHKKGV